MKEITTLFETIGKRRKLIGFEAKYNGEIIGTFDTRDEAQAELDRIAYELAKVARLRFDAGVLCSFCGDEHADSACPQKRPLLAPRVCGNCGGQHSIQQCSDIRRLLFAA